MFRVTAMPPAVAAGSARSHGLRHLSFAALGTTCEVQYVAPADPVAAGAFELAAVRWVQRFEEKYSRFRPDSLISRINDAAGRNWVEVDADAEQLFALCDAVVQMTSGVLDPTVLPLMRLWNWKAERPVVPDRAAISAARELVGWKKVERQQGRIFLPRFGMALDFGGFGKEYAVDIVAQIALNHGIANVLVDFGHDIRVYGTPPGRPAWHIGLEDPARPGRIAGSLAVAGSRGVASSGDYLRCFRSGGKRYGHIIDPRTGWPVGNGCLQATIVADTCLQAGVLSTVAFMHGVPQAIDFIQGYPQAEGLVVTETARAQTRGFHRYVAT